MLPQRAGSETELRDIVATMWRWKWVIVAITLIVTGSVYFITSRQAEQWEATAEVLVRGRETADVVGEGSANPQEASRDLVNELAYIQSDEVRTAIADRVGGPARVTARTLGEGDVISFRAEGTNPVRVADIANKAAEVYVELRAQRVITDYVEAASIVQQQIDAVVAEQESLSGPVEAFRATMDPNETNEFGIPVNSEAEINAYLAELDRLEEAIRPDLARLDATETTLLNTLGQLEIGTQLLSDGTAQVIRSARVPTDPFAPELVKNVLIGAVAGLLLGLATAFLLDYLDRSIRSKSDIERVSDVRLLAAVPHVRGWRKRTPSDLVDLARLEPAAVESYRSVWTTIEYLGGERPIHRILVTSPLSNEGKTTTAANLGVTIANAGRKVVLVDCDLRRPTLHDAFGLPNDVGFTSVVGEKISPEKALHTIPHAPNLRVLTSGPTPNPDEPIGYLTSERTKELLAWFGETHDFVIVDSPPVLPVSDPSILSRFVDGVIMVVRAGATSEPQLVDSVRILEQGETPLLGVMLNGARARTVYRYDGDRGDYAARESDTVSTSRLEGSTLAPRREAPAPAAAPAPRREAPALAAHAVVDDVVDVPSDAGAFVDDREAPPADVGAFVDDVVDVPSEAAVSEIEGQLSTLEAPLSPGRQIRWRRRP